MERALWVCYCVNPGLDSLSVMLALAWALLAAAQIVEHLVRGYRVDITELLIVSASIVFLILFGLHLATSSRIKSFLNE